MRKFWVWVLVPVLIAFLGGVCVASAGSTGATFLKIWVGARFEALGGASVAIPDGAEAMNSNIAGLMSLKTPDVTLMHNEYMMDMTQEYAAFGMPLNKKSAIGASLIFVDAGTFYGFTAANQPTGTFTAKDMAFSVGYALSVRDDVNIGAAVKYVKSEIANESASTIALDAGAVWTLPKSPWTLGISITNVGSGLKFIAEEDDLPTTLTIGTAYRFEKEPVLVTGQVSFPKSDDAIMNFGAEYTLMDVLRLRAGYNSSNDLDNGFTFGMGFAEKNYRVDYGYVPLGVFGDSHRFSLSVAF